MAINKSRKFFGAAALAMLIAVPVLARDGKPQRGSNTPRVVQPHTRTTERQRTENGHTRSDTWTRADGKTASRDAVVTRDRAAGTRTREVDYSGPNGHTANVDSVRTKTDDGFTRSTTITNAQGETATRDLTVSRDEGAGTITRESNYTTFDGREGAKSDVIQRTEDGFSRDTTRMLPNGETHTRSVDVSCEKDVGKCVKQVEIDQQP